MKTKHLKSYKKNVNFHYFNSKQLNNLQYENIALNDVDLEYSHVYCLYIIQYL